MGVPSASATVGLYALALAPLHYARSSNKRSNPSRKKKTQALYLGLYVLFKITSKFATIFLVKLMLV